MMDFLDVVNCGCAAIPRDIYTKAIECRTSNLDGFSSQGSGSIVCDVKYKK